MLDACSTGGKHLTICCVAGSARLYSLVTHYEHRVFDDDHSRKLD